MPITTDQIAILISDGAHPTTRRMVQQLYTALLCFYRLHQRSFSRKTPAVGVSRRHGDGHGLDTIPPQSVGLAAVDIPQQVVSPAALNGRATLIAFPIPNSNSALPYVTQLPKQLIDAMDIVDLDIEPNLSLLSRPLLWNRAGPPNPLHPFILGQVASISFFGEEQKNKIRSALSVRKKHVVLRFRHLYQGPKQVVSKVVPQTANQILRGSDRFFLFRMPLRVLNLSTMEYEIVSFVGLGCCDSTLQNARFRKSVTNLLSFLQAASAETADLSQYLDHDLWIATCIKSMSWLNPFLAKTLIAYNCLPQAPIDHFEAYDELHEVVSKSRFLHEGLVYLSGSRQYKNTAEYKALCKIQLALKRQKAELSNLKSKEVEIHERKALSERSVLLNYNTIESHRQAIASSETLIAIANTNQKVYDNNLVTVADEINAVEAAVGNTENQLSAAEATLNSAASVGSKPAEAKWFNSLRKLGVLITRLSFSHPERGLVDLKTIAASPNLADSARIQHLNFVTLKPVVIYVDRDLKEDLCKKVVGGPYSVQLIFAGPDTFTFCLRPASLNSIFAAEVGDGDRTLRLAAHPHVSWVDTGATVADLDNWARSWQRPCLGELFPALATAYAQNDPKLAIYAVMSWLSTANSADPYGAKYKYFPPLEEVDAATFNDWQPIVETGPTEPTATEAPTQAVEVATGATPEPTPELAPDTDPPATMNFAVTADIITAPIYLQPTNNETLDDAAAAQYEDEGYFEHGDYDDNYLDERDEEGQNDEDEYRPYGGPRLAP